jgi:hypothetical protein
MGNIMGDTTYTSVRWVGTIRVVTGLGLNKSPEKRKLQQRKCQEYYQKNQGTIYIRHRKNLLKNNLEKKLKKAWFLRGLLNHTPDG